MRNFLPLILFETSKQRRTLTLRLRQAAAMLSMGFESFFRSSVKLAHLNARLQAPGVS